MYFLQCTYICNQWYSIILKYAHIIHVKNPKPDPKPNPKNNGTTICTNIYYYHIVILYLQLYIDKHILFCCEMPRSVLHCLSIVQEDCVDCVESTFVSASGAVEQSPVCVMPMSRKSIALPIIGIDHTSPHLCSACVVCYRQKINPSVCVYGLKVSGGGGGRIMTPTISTKTSQESFWL